jgi:hypothetical protein
MSRHTKLIDSFEDIEGLSNGQGAGIELSGGNMPMHPYAQFDIFNMNIAEYLEKTGQGNVVSKIGADLKELVDDDFQSGEDWRSGLAVGIRQLGTKFAIMGKVPETELPYEGASTVNSLAFIETFLQFASLYRTEMLPANGPCKIMIPGEPSDEMEDAGDRITDFMNLYFTDLYKSFYDEKELGANWAYMAGSSFTMVIQDPTSKYCKPISPCIWPTNIIVNNEEVVSLEKCRRITHRQIVTAHEMRRLRDAGYYRKTSIDGSDTLESEVVTESVRGLTGFRERTNQENKSYERWDVHTYLDIQGLNPPGQQVPYIVTMEAKSGNVLRIAPNWKRNDPEFTVDKKFIQTVYQRGFGLYGMGMAHIAAGFAQSAAEIKRIAINTAELSAYPGGFMPSDLRSTQTEMDVAPNTFNRIQTGGRPIDEVLKLMPYRDPSPTLISLGDSLEQGIKDLSAVSNTAINDINGNTAGMTTVAMLNSSYKAQAAFISRFHKALAEEFASYYDFFAENLTGQEMYPFAINAEEMPMKPDFEHGLNLIPVSDPNNNSQLMRIIKNETILKIAEQNPEIHNLPEIYKRVYESMDVANIDAILIDNEKKAREAEEAAVPQDVISQTYALLRGEPCKTDIQQDAESHAQYLSSFLNTLSPEVQAPIIQATKLLILDYKRLGYLKQVCQQYNIELPADFTNLPIEVQNGISMLAAQEAQKQAEEAQQSRIPEASEVMAQDVQNKAQEADARIALDRSKAELDLLKTKIKAMTDLQKQEMLLQFKNDELKLKNDLEMHQSHLEYLQNGIGQAGGANPLQRSTIYPQLSHALDENLLPS